MYQSLRQNGYKAGEEGYSIWRPIPPTGYVALGDVFHYSPTGDKPNKNIIRCVPKECIDEITPFNNYVNNDYSFKTPDSITDFNGQSNVVVRDIGGQKRDTDKITNENCKLNWRLYNPSIIPEVVENENARNPDGTLKNLNILNNHLHHLNLFRSDTEDMKFYKVKYQYIYDDSRELDPRGLLLMPKEKFSKDYSILKIYED